MQKGEMLFLPAKLRDMSLYEPVSERAAVCLDANESCFPWDNGLREAVNAALSRAALHRYPDPLCTECRELAAAYYNVPVGCLAAGDGSDGLIDVLLGAFFQAGDTLLCAVPDFSMYQFYARLREVKVRELPRKKGLPDIDALIEASGEVQGLIFSNPCNPTGQGLPRSDILRLIEKARCLVVLDEAYMDFYGESVAEEAVRHDHVIVLKTCSKAIGLAGIRLGFAIACPERAALLRSLKSPYDVSALTQAAGAALLSRPDILKQRCEALLERRRDLYALLQTWAAVRKGVELTDTVTNFVLLTLADADKLHAHLASRDVAVRLLPGCLRITAGTAEEHDFLRKALDEYKD